MRPPVRSVEGPAPPSVEVAPPNGGAPTLGHVERSALTRPEPAADGSPRSGTQPSHPGDQPLAGRLGLDVPADWWPTGPTIKAAEAAGFAWTQFHAPPAAVLRDAQRRAEHAAALRSVLNHGSQQLILHAPAELRAGTDEEDHTFAGLLAYARDVRARIVVYHGGNFPVESIGAWNRAEDRASMEERSLRRYMPEIEALRITLAIENLAPVYAAPVCLCHAPSWVARMVTRLESRHVGMCFDIGHAHIVAGVTGTDVRGLLEPIIDQVALFHLHDNLGARVRGDRAAGVDPLRLDLHLPPGMGTVRWDRLGSLLSAHPAPLQLEIHPPHRPDAVNLATITAGLLGPARLSAGERA